ncbi:neuronal acetylcholine receptor subunit non-alpha-3-like isoform X2 [Pecten maximus]|uniref:neuronal acetylcholine receptor subunit non-alpha-3-like isoform X2 n=1 Tax=Pecten maximus TaxID=6579 RepID=UPI001458635A|nr:neuronal acetylcholine receptor subunit non-alpha-3-like isoform X2 [Pecten maximus]
MVDSMGSNSASWPEIFLWIYILSILSSSAGKFVFKENDEDRLYKDMMRYYVKSSRPVLVSNSTGFNVDMGMASPRLELLDTSTDTMTISFHHQISWQDERLQWNASDYGNLKTMPLPPDSIWLPELEVYNVSPFHPSSTKGSSLTVSSTGLVNYVPIKTISFYCPLDLSKFPYDTQTCVLKIGAWSHSSSYQNMTYYGKTEPRELFLDESQGGHPQWTIDKAVAYIQRIKYVCCPDAFVNLAVNITVTRVASYYRLALVGPSVFLAILIPVVFLLPPDQTSRTNYGMILLMTMTVMMVVFQEAVPFNHATIPVIVVFYFAIFVLQFFSILCCAFTGNLRHMGARRKALPAWLGSLCIQSRRLRMCLCLDSNFPGFQEPDTPVNIRLVGRIPELGTGHRTRQCRNCSDGRTLTTRSEQHKNYGRKNPSREHVRKAGT